LPTTFAAAAAAAAICSSLQVVVDPGGRRWITTAPDDEAKMPLAGLAAKFFGQQRSGRGDRCRANGRERRSVVLDIVVAEVEGSGEVKLRRRVGIGG
jgi:hypothetical protein